MHTPADERNKLESPVKLRVLLDGLAADATRYLRDGARRHSITRTCRQARARPRGGRGAAPPRLPEHRRGDRAAARPAPRRRSTSPDVDRRPGARRRLPRRARPVRDVTGERARGDEQPRVAALLPPLARVVDLRRDGPDPEEHHCRARARPSERVQWTSSSRPSSTSFGRLLWSCLRAACRSRSPARSSAARGTSPDLWTISPSSAGTRRARGRRRIRRAGTVRPRAGARRRRGAQRARRRGRRGAHRRDRGNRRDAVAAAGAADGWERRLARCRSPSPVGRAGARDRGIARGVRILAVGDEIDVHHGAACR